MHIDARGRSNKGKEIDWEKEVKEHRLKNALYWISHGSRLISYYDLYYVYVHECAFM